MWTWWCWWSAWSTPPTSCWAPGHSAYSSPRSHSSASRTTERKAFLRFWIKGGVSWDFSTSSFMIDCASKINDCTLMLNRLLQHCDAHCNIKSELELNNEWFRFVNEMAILNKKLAASLDLNKASSWKQIAQLLNFNLKQTRILSAL